MKAHAEIQRSAQPARISQPFFQRNKSNPFYSSNAIQLKPVLGKPNDKFEQEADRVADAVVEGKNATTTTEDISTLQRKCSNCEEEEKVQAKFFTQTDSIQRQNEAEEEEALQAKPLDNVQRKGEDEEEAAQAKPLDQVQRVSEEEEEEAAQAKSMTNSPATVSNSFASQLSGSSGNGSSLPKAVQAKMSNHIGADFSSVRIHTNSQAAEMSQSIQAKAFTHGNNIYFNQGQYNPETKTGQHLLAHELTHTVQQGAVRRMVQKTPSTSSRPDIENRYGLGIGGFSNHYDATLNRNITTVTLRMKVKFDFTDDISPWPSEASKLTWRDSFINTVQNRWSYRYYLIPQTTCANEANVYYARVNIIPVTANQHYTMNIRYSTEFQGSSVGRTSRTATMDALDVRQRADIRQVPSEHEFGHMLGLPHVHCDSNAARCYGVTPEEKADIMGVGSNVSTTDYSPFTSTMYYFTGCNWIASHSTQN